MLKFRFSQYAKYANEGQELSPGPLIVKLEHPRDGPISEGQQVWWKGGLGDAELLREAFWGHRHSG